MSQSHADLFLDAVYTVSLVAVVVLVFAKKARLNFFVPKLSLFVEVEAGGIVHRPFSIYPCP